jgi:GTP cyclohydrolase II
MLPAAVTAPLGPGSLARLSGDAANNNLLHVDAEAIAKYPAHAADTLQPISQARLPLAAAENARIIGFRPADGGAEHFAIVVGEPAAHQPALCRLHSECFTGDILGSLRCDCGAIFNGFFNRIIPYPHNVRSKDINIGQTFLGLAIE